MRGLGSISGGVGSWLAARTFVDRGGGPIELLFTDTLMEDQDAYRLLILGAANLLGIELPKSRVPEISDFPAWEDREAYKVFCQNLADDFRWSLPGFHWVNMGLDPFDIYEREGFLGNSSVDPCSKFAKRIMSRRWLREHRDPADTVVILGIGHEEPERFYGGAKSQGYKARMAKDGWSSVAPLCDRPWFFPPDVVQALAANGLWVPRLTQLGYAHNNCGGMCCKAGFAHWRKFGGDFPERFAYCAWREGEIRKKLGNYAMLRSRVGGVRTPVPLAELPGRPIFDGELYDFGGCRCFTG